MVAPILNKNGWKGSVKGWMITDVAVRQKDVVCLLLRERFDYSKASWDHDIPSRLVSISLSRPRDANQRSHQGLSGFNLPVLGVWRLPNQQSLGMIAAKNLDGDVWPMGGQMNSPMEHIAQGKQPFPHRLKCINGYTYAVCSGRRIYKRTQAARWEVFAELPQAPEHWHMGFKDLDAFSENDMYAVGGCGDIWHFDGSHWTQLGFPTNAQLGTVTCAPDGKVYVSGEGGSLWAGRENAWKKIYSGSSSLLWNDALWFDGRLWLASDYQLRVWDGDKLKAVEEDGKPVPAYGHMDAYDGLLVVAGPEFVYGFDGKAWTVLVAPYRD